MSSSLSLNQSLSILHALGKWNSTEDKPILNRKHLTLKRARYGWDSEGITQKVSRYLRGEFDPLVIAEAFNVISERKQMKKVRELKEGFFKSSLQGLFVLRESYVKNKGKDNKICQNIKEIFLRAHKQFGLEISLVHQLKFGYEEQKKMNAKHFEVLLTKKKNDERKKIAVPNAQLWNTGLFNFAKFLMEEKESKVREASESVTCDEEDWVEVGNEDPEEVEIVSKERQLKREGSVGDLSKAERPILERSHNSTLFDPNTIKELAEPKNGFLREAILLRRIKLGFHSQEVIKDHGY